MQYAVCFETCFKKHPKSPFFWVHPDGVDCVRPAARSRNISQSKLQSEKHKTCIDCDPSCKPKSEKVANWWIKRKTCLSCFLNFVTRQRKIARQDRSPTKRIYALTNLTKREGNLEIQLEHTGCTLRTRISWITRWPLTRKSEKKKTDSNECQTSGKPLN